MQKKLQFEKFSSNIKSRIEVQIIFFSQFLYQLRILYEAQ